MSWWSIPHENGSKKDQGAWITTFLIHGWWATGGQMNFKMMMRPKLDSASLLLWWAATVKNAVTVSPVIRNNKCLNYKSPGNIWNHLHAEFARLLLCQTPWHSGVQSFGAPPVHTCRVGDSNFCGLAEMRWRSYAARCKAPRLVYV